MRRAVSGSLRRRSFGAPWARAPHHHAFTRKVQQRRELSGEENDLLERKCGVRRAAIAADVCDESSCVAFFAIVVKPAQPVRCCMGNASDDPDEVSGPCTFVYDENKIWPTPGLNPRLLGLRRVRRKSGRTIVSTWRNYDLQRYRV